MSNSAQDRPSTQTCAWHYATARRQYPVRRWARPLWRCPRAAGPRRAVGAAHQWHDWWYVVGHDVVSGGSSGTSSRARVVRRGRRPVVVRRGRRRVVVRRDDERVVRRGRRVVRRATSSGEWWFVGDDVSGGSSGTTQWRGWFVGDDESGGSSGTTQWRGWFVGDDVSGGSSGDDAVARVVRRGRRRSGGSSGTTQWSRVVRRGRRLVVVRRARAVVEGGSSGTTSSGGSSGTTSGSGWVRRGRPVVVRRGRPVASGWFVGDDQWWFVGDDVSGGSSGTTSGGSSGTTSVVVRRDDQWSSSGRRGRASSGEWWFVGDDVSGGVVGDDAVARWVRRGRPVVVVRRVRRRRVGRSGTTSGGSSGTTYVGWFVERDDQSVVPPGRPVVKRFVGDGLGLDRSIGWNLRRPERFRFADSWLSLGAW